MESTSLSPARDQPSLMYSNVGGGGENQHTWEETRTSPTGTWVHPSSDVMWSLASSIARGLMDQGYRQILEANAQETKPPLDSSVPPPEMG